MAMTFGRAGGHHGQERDAAGRHLLVVMEVSEIIAVVSPDTFKRPILAAAADPGLSSFVENRLQKVFLSTPAMRQRLAGRPERQGHGT